MEDGAVWSYWDLWFCAVWTADFQGDREALAGRLRRNHDGPPGRPEWEALVSHLDDLAGRLEAHGLTPGALAREAVSDRNLMAKARRKVLEQGLGAQGLTPAMADTPRARLGRRALRGYWDRFPVSPEASYEAFAVPIARRAADRSRRYGLVRPFLSCLQRLDKGSGHDPACRLAVYRAFLAAGLEAMDRGLGSGGVVDLLTSTLFDYLGIPWEQTGVATEDYYRDMCELLVWEDYALTFERETLPFERIAPEHALLAEEILWSLEAEYRGHGLEYHALRAAENLAYLNACLGRFDRMAPTAQVLGPDGWVAVRAMAEAALAAGRGGLAMEVFSAADRPGLLRDNLRRASVDLLGNQPRLGPRLRLVR